MFRAKDPQTERGVGDKAKKNGRVLWPRKGPPSREVNWVTLCTTTEHMDLLRVAAMVVAAVAPTTHDRWKHGLKVEYFNLTKYLALTPWIGVQNGGLHAQNNLHGFKQPSTRFAFVPHNLKM